MRTFSAIVVFFCFITTQSCAQSSKKMDFETYNPPSTLVVPEHKLTRAKYPFIDVHNHQWDMPNQNIHELVTQMDNLHMQVMVNLSGRGYRDVNGQLDVNGHDYFVRSLDKIKEVDARRVVLFTNISFEGFGSPGWIDKALKELALDVQSGARGLKIYKDLGLYYKITTTKLYGLMTRGLTLFGRNVVN